MKKLLTFPTWLVFLLMILPVFFPENKVGSGLLIIWALSIAYSIYFLGSSLYQKLPPGHDLKINRFYFNLLFLIVYLFVHFIVFERVYKIDSDNFWEMVLLLPQIYVMYCYFYIIWFIAKSIATIENKRVVGFNNYGGTVFVLLFFIVIAIWWVHPRVRKIFTDENASTGIVSDLNYN